MKLSIAKDEFWKLLEMQLFAGARSLSRSVDLLLKLLTYLT